MPRSCYPIWFPRHEEVADPYRIDGEPFLVQLEPDEVLVSADVEGGERDAEVTAGHAPCQEIEAHDQSTQQSSNDEDRSGVRPYEHEAPLDIVIAHHGPVR